MKRQIVVLVGLSSFVAVAESIRDYRLPKEGMYLSSIEYDAYGRLAWAGGNNHTQWCPSKPDVLEVPRLVRELNQGNSLRQWFPKNDVLTNLIALTYKEGLAASVTQGQATPEQVKWIRENGVFTCYDLHETITPGLPEGAEDAADPLVRSADDYIRRMTKMIGDAHAAGWWPVTSSTASFDLDYRMLSGLDVPGIEFFPYPQTSLAMSLCRGMARQYGVPVWHAYLAHDWYSYLPHTNPHKMDSLMMMLRMQYMSGAKLVILESGNWWSQANLCPDSPQTYLPPVKAKAIGQWLEGDEAKKAVTDDMLLEAKRKFSWIDFRSPVVTKYRQVMSDFWDFVKQNPAPKGQPEAVIALAKGNLDVASHGTSESDTVVGAEKLVVKDHHWKVGAPEKSRQLANEIFYPKPANVKPNRNLFFSATPYGQVDVVSFAKDNITADFLVRNYKAVVFSGWNTCTPKQYRVLCDYVTRGGKLCLGLAHLSTNVRRNYDYFTQEELINGGDFSELCGLKVKGKGAPFWWATGPAGKPNALGLVAHRRYGIMGLPMADLEFTGKMEDYEVLSEDDEAVRPVIVRCKSGKGEVYFLNVWHYPFEANRDDGAGAVEGSKGLVGELYSCIGRTVRGNVWITGPDFVTPDEDCNWINYSYFPEAGRICLMNLDYDRERKCVMHWFGEKDFITLKPGEFRLMDAPVLDRDEMLNAPL